MQQAINGIFLGSIYALFAVGYTLVFGVLDILNLAHSAVFMVGAAITYSLVVNYHQTFLVACLLGIAACAFVGLVIEVVAVTVRLQLVVFRIRAGQLGCVQRFGRPAQQRGYCVVLVVEPRHCGHLPAGRQQLDDQPWRLRRGRCVLRGAGLVVRGRAAR